jgi:H+/Cl- antiporter ClcA
MAGNKSSLYRYFSDISDFKWEMALKSLLAGAAAGLLAVIYRLATEKGTDFAVSAFGYMKLHPVFIVIWVIAAAAAGLFIAWLIKLEPMASGGGVPQVEGVVLYGMKMKWYAVIAVRYAAGILGSLFGLSFGPEGPSIQLGAAVNQGLSKKVCKTKIGENYLVTAGAAAGLSAAFSAPLTGMIFALEEIHRSFSPTILLSATAASLTADFISKYFFGLKPILYFQSVTQLPLNMYAWLFPLGIFVGFFGVIINRGMLLLQTLYNKFSPKARPTIALLICLPCGLLLPEVLGGGRNLINIIESTKYTFAMVAILLLIKLLFSCTSFGSGAPGGIFMPIISISALSGSVFGIIAVHFGAPSEFLPVFVICAMAGGLSSCVKAPVTSIILTVELTGSFTHILPVAICTFVALFISDMLKTTPIYEALLKRYIVKNGYTISTEKRGELMEFPVEYGSEISERLLKNIEWPKGSLIVGLRRGSEELIPKGDTKIMPGDYLLILAPKNKENIIKRKVKSLCHKN